MIENNIYYLTNPQKSIWLTEQYFPNTSLNVISGNILIEEKINTTLMEQAVNLYLQKNEEIRARIIVQDGVAKQYIKDYEFFKLNIISIHSQEELENHSKVIAHTPFSLIDSDLFKFTLFLYPDGHGALSTTLHHLISDAWGLSLFIKEVIHTYSQLLNNLNCDSTLNPSYIDYLDSEQKYLNSDKYLKDGNFWNSSFNFEPKITSITSMPKVSFSIEAKRRSFQLDSNLYHSISSFCKDANCSIYNFFMGIYSIYIAKINQTNIPIIGTPILNRSNYKEKHTAGMFISTVPFYTELDFSNTIMDTLQSINKQQLSIFRHQKYPYQDLLSNISKKYEIANNIYDVALSYQNARDDSNSSEINYHTEWYFNGAISDTLDIHFYDMDSTGILNFYYDYQVEKLNESDIDRIHNRILYMIEQVVRKPDILLKDISIITPQEEQQLEKFNSSFVEHPKNIGIHELIENNADLYPDHTAIFYNKETISYKKMIQKVNLIAKNLIKKGVKKGDCVSVLFRDKNINLICSLLGILKAGACFLAIYPDYPNERIQYMLENSQSKLLLTEKNFSSINFHIATFFIEDLEEIGENCSFPKSYPDDNAYIIYTSGSTGNPKGTMQTHNNIINFVYSFQHFLDDSINTNDHMLSVTNICFDVSMAEIFTPLVFGASLYLYKDLNYSNLYDLCKYIVRYNITFSYFPPSTLQTVYNELKKFTDIPLNKLLVGVEPIKASILQSFLTLNNNMKIINGYGPSETTICCTMYRFNPNLLPDAITPIGSPIGNSTILILDDDKHPTPIGEIGEVFVQGECVGNGYLNDEKKTKEKFDLTNKIYQTGDLAKWLPDGNILFVGRNDNQIKYRGYRIDLGEIEHAIKNIIAVENCVVLLNNSLDNNSNLIAFITLKNGNISEEAFRDTLTQILPHYMIPNQFIFIDSFPLTPNGKIDRKSLIKLASHKKITIYTAPTTESEKKLASIWSSVLEKEKIGINDNFFDLGGDSLDAIKIVTMAAQQQINLSAQSFYNYPTISLLLKHSQTPTIQEEDNYSPKVPILKEVPTSLTGDILLIGATGFLGSHILYELMTKTSLKVYCLIRGTSLPQAIDRLKKRLQYYFGDALTSYFEGRIIVIKGDFSKPQLGISEKSYQDLLHHIKTVINSAAIVKHIGDYDYFYKVNILSVESLIDFCKQCNNAQLVHISTLSVSGNNSSEDGIHTFKEDDLYIHQQINDNIYIQTKFEAEQLIVDAIEKDHLPATIFRLGNITWRFSDATFQINEDENLFFNIVKFILLTKQLPLSLKDYPINISPVDNCADLMIQILMKQNIYNVYHIYNSNLLTLGTIIDMLRHIGYSDINFVSNEEYQKSLNEFTNIPLYSYVSEFFHIKDLKDNILVDNPYTLKTIENLDFHWSRINSSYFQKRFGGAKE